MITKQEESVGYLFVLEQKEGQGNFGHTGRPGQIGGSGGSGGDREMGGFDSQQISYLESKISDQLPEPIEFTYINRKNGVYNGGIQWDASDKNKSGKGTIEFTCLPAKDRITDLKILNLTGGMKGINQSIFSDR